MYSMTPETIRIARDAGVTASSALLVLLALAAQAEPLTMRVAAGYAGVSTAALTGTVDRLVVLGLVRRWTPAEDRRKVLLGLDEKGWELMDQCAAKAVELEGVA